MLELLTLIWLFSTTQGAQSTLAMQAPQAVFAAPADAAKGFTIKFTVDLKKFNGKKNILEIPNVLSVYLQQHNPLDRNRQNYPAFKLPDGSVPVLEANLILHSIEHPEWKNMSIGIPLAMLKKPEGEHEVVLNFTGVRWTMFVDGVLLDNDFPFGYPQWADQTKWHMDAEYVKNAALYFPAITPEKKPVQASRAVPIQYWSPPGHNSWVGDVATYFHQGRYHIFYLYDRRHHQSKFGKGAHYFEHLSTTDFKTWTEHEAATPLDEQWECIGTGAPFFYDGKFCLSYGLHTTRIYPNEKTMFPIQWDYLEKNGTTFGFKRATTPFVPAGATYAISEDGVSRFKKSWTFFHPSQNPMVYTDPSGKLRMLANAGARGIWESEAVDSGWRCISPEFPPGGDCTFFFHWGKFDYIIGGFSGLWSKPAAAPNSAYQDVVSKGLDFYDGSNVPAITEIPGGRFLMAAWIPIRGWGGPLIMRELIQLPDGRIGSKWMKEITPATAPPRALAVSADETITCPVGSKSFMLTFDAQGAGPKQGRVGISFLPESGDQAACEFQIQADAQRAQFGVAARNNFAGQEKSLREGGAPQKAGNYAIENLIGVDRPFTVRLIVKADDKIGGSLIDAEIAGQRTMISYRPDLTVKKLRFRLQEAEIKNVQFAPFD